MFPPRPPSDKATSERPGLLASAGFTLIEVAISLGIICVTFIPLLALMSMGFSSLQDSNADVRTSMIAQKLIAAAQLTPYGQLVDQTHQLDIEGNSVPAAEAIFVAAVKISKAPADNLLSSSNAARISVSITGSALHNSERIYTATLANLGD